MIEITRQDFSVDQALSRLRKGEMGCIVSFVGVGRGESKGRKVLRMEIQVYDEMARRQLEGIRGEAMERFGAEEIDIIHRVGNLEVSDNIVMIAVGAAHRSEAFDACRYVLENLKKRVPIWKKEVTAEGDFWIEGETP
jgi:molybdopterin synthase catalytic subunit